MKAFILVALFGLFLMPLSAAEHEVIYTEGFPLRRDNYGLENDLAIGDSLETGDSVLTAQSDFVELWWFGRESKVLCRFSECCPVLLRRFSP